MLEILGTDLRTNCACSGTAGDFRELFECIEYRRLFWLNPCVVDAQKDYHIKGGGGGGGGGNTPAIGGRATPRPRATSRPRETPPPRAKPTRRNQKPPPTTPRPTTRRRTKPPQRTRPPGGRGPPSQPQGPPRAKPTQPLSSQSEEPSPGPLSLPLQ